MVIAVDVSPLDFFSKVSFHPEVMVALVAASGAYWWGVRRVRAKGETWPQTRSAAAVGAIALMAAATLSGLDFYDRTSFSVHSGDLTILVMFAPVLIALSAPSALAVAATSGARSQRISAWLTGRVSRVLNHPVTAWVLYGITFGVLFWSGVYAYTITHGWAMDLLYLWLVVAGCVLVWPAMGKNPVAHRFTAGFRALHLLFGLLFYTMFGMALESQTSRIAPHITVTDLHTGAGNIWAAGALFTIILAAGVMVAWLMNDERRAGLVDEGNFDEDVAQLMAWRATRDSRLTKASQDGHAVRRNGPAPTGSP